MEKLRESGISSIAKSRLSQPAFMLVSNLEDEKSDFDRYVLEGEMPQTEPELKNLEQYLREIAIPNWIPDLAQNSFRLAVALAFVDSRRLPPEVREDLGLTPFFQDDPSKRDYRKYPTLFVPNGKEVWLTQCAEANSKLRYTMRKFDGRPDSFSNDKNAVAFELAGCLVGKVNGMVSALCFETKEFPNGSLFLKDIWYRVRTPGLETELNNLAYDAVCKTNISPEVLYEESDDPLITSGMVVWENCGGLWQPTRSFYHEENYSFPVLVPERNY